MALFVCSGCVMTKAYIDELVAAFLSQGMTRDELGIAEPAHGEGSASRRTELGIAGPGHGEPAHGEAALLIQSGPSTAGLQSSSVVRGVDHRPAKRGRSPCEGRALGQADYRRAKRRRSPRGASGV